MGEAEPLTHAERVVADPTAGVSRYMSEATVKSHVSRVMAKLGAANRVQVAITARDADPT
jgi:hypothetical protein